MKKLISHIQRIYYQKSCTGYLIQFLVVLRNKDDVFSMVITLVFKIAMFLSCILNVCICNGNKKCNFV